MFYVSRFLNVKINPLTDTQFMQFEFIKITIRGQNGIRSLQSLNILQLILLIFRMKSLLLKSETFLILHRDNLNHCFLICIANFLITFYIKNIFSVYFGTDVYWVHLISHKKYRESILIKKNGVFVLICLKKYSCLANTHKLQNCLKFPNFRLL